MSGERGPEYLETVYLFGTPDEVIASLQARVDAGVEQFILHTMTPDPRQLHDWVDEIIPNVGLPGTAGPVRSRTVARWPSRRDPPGRPPRQAAPAAAFGRDAQRGLRRRRHRRRVRARGDRRGRTSRALSPRARQPDFWASA